MRNPSFCVSPASRTVLVAILSAFSAGCSADVARFDFPSASLTDNSGTTTGAIPTPTEPMKQRSNLIGSESVESAPVPAGSSSEGGAYFPARTPGREPVKMAALPDASAPPAQPPAATARQSLAPSSEPAAAASREPAAQAAPQVAAKGDQIEVQPGDTLFGLSKRHHVSVSELMSVNELKGPGLRPGQKLYLPANRTTRLPLVKAAPAPAVTAEAPADWTGSYTVKPGDSLYAIARQHKVKFTDLQRFNGIQDVRRVKPGMVLRMPAGDGPTLAAAPASETQPAMSAAPAAAPQQTLQQAAAQQDAAPSAPSVQPSIINAAPAPAEQKVAALTPPASTATDAQAASAPSASKPASGSVASAGKLRWPVQGKIISGFGQRTDGTHNDGVNLAVPLGTEVHAAEDGVVAYAGSELKGYGNLILVRHDNGWVTAYAHAEELLVKRGDKVSRGQVIAKAGKSGQVDQPQVHFELRQGQKPVDPTPFMEKI